jgi:hypothetical protein
MDRASNERCSCLDGSENPSSITTPVKIWP